METMGKALMYCAGLMVLAAVAAAVTAAPGWFVMAGVICLLVLGSALYHEGKVKSGSRPR